MLIKTFLNSFKLSDDIVNRLGNVLIAATANGDDGVVDWVHVAMNYAVNGKLRDRDMANLSRLEATYSNDYYRNATRTGQLQFA